MTTREDKSMTGMILKRFAWALIYMCLVISFACGPQEKAEEQARSVALEKSPQTFEPVRTVEPGLADRDGDGDLDVAAGSTTGDVVKWWANDGLSPPGWTATTISTGGDAQNLVLADLDKDGDLDVFATDDNVVWWENTDGAGGTWSYHAITSGSAYTQPAASDFDADGTTAYEFVATLGGGHYGWDILPGQ